MIARLEGIVALHADDACVIDVNGVGYLVTVPLTVRVGLPGAGEPIVLYIYHHTWEDGAALFGFRTWEERRLFQMLLSVSGVGPKVALAVLSGLTAQDLVLIIAGADVQALTRIPGVGRKTAERVVLELREKMLRLVEGTDWALAIATRATSPGGGITGNSGQPARRKTAGGKRAGGSGRERSSGGDAGTPEGAAGTGDGGPPKDIGPGAIPDAVAALVALGYSVAEAAAAVNRLGAERFALSADTIVRAVLRGEMNGNARTGS